MIELKITADTADELFADLHSLAAKNGPVPVSSPANYASVVEVPASVAETAVVSDIPAPPVSETAPPPPPVTEGPATVTTDSAGVTFDPELHTGTLKKDGTWRMKRGAVADDTPPPPPVAAEDDEFAAFATAEAAPAAPVARKWSDADLSKLCNQGASKDGNPDRVKAIIAKFVPEGEVQHSRNIPEGVREDFAVELESTIGIQYAG